MDGYQEEKGYGTKFEWDRPVWMESGYAQLAAFRKVEHLENSARSIDREHCIRYGLDRNMERYIYMKQHV